MTEIWHGEELGFHFQNLFIIKAGGYLPYSCGGQMAVTPDMAIGSAGDSVAIPVGRFRTLREVNERNCQFWLKQASLMEQRMADEDVYCAAVKDLRSEALRQVPVYSQRSFEAALEVAANAKIHFQRHAAESFQIAFSKKGGSASKTDALQKLILEIARKNPSVTERKLRAELENRKLGPVVDDIDEELGTIDFNNDRQEKSARISGLKDRLSRAKKKIATEEKIDSR